MTARPSTKKTSIKNSKPVVQQLVLNGSGQILASDDLLFSTTKMGAESIFGRIPFFEGLLPSLFLPKKKEGETVVNCVQMATKELPGIYDFHFLSIFWNAEPALSCSIVERTEHYLLRRELQQVEMEAALTLEKRALAQ